MDNLIKLAEKIKDKDLREKTISLLKDPKLSNPALACKPLKIEDTPGGFPGFEHHMEKGGLIKHTEGVTLLAMQMADFVEERYGTVNKDFVITAALLHDIMRLYDFDKIGDEYSLQDNLLEHEELGACELYARGFPEEIVHMVLKHLKPEGQGLEGTILHYADSVDSFSDFYFRELSGHECGCECCHDED
ncbi:MAG: HDIG domain-containing protein [Candidatus Aenigmarchaeota archaeon]|nr:HDIG domain-containing protein [Candidatus Aenigmarchaeota archaeon]